MTQPKPNHTEYSDPKIVANYNILNKHYPLEKQFYLDLAKEIGAKKIVDIGCGTGMLTLELARLGYEVTGIEPAKEMLEVAWQNPISGKVKWIHGDALVLKESMIDMTLMSTHVFQCFIKDHYLEKVLQTINKSLKTCGILVFDSRNSELPLKDCGWPSKTKPTHFISNKGEEISSYVDILDRKKNYVLYEMHYFNHKTKEELTSVNELIFRSQEEITEFLNKAGFEVENIYGDWDKSPVSKTSPEFIFVARKIA